MAVEKRENRVRVAAGLAVRGSSAHETTYVQTTLWAEVQLLSEAAFNGPDRFVLRSMPASSGGAEGEEDAEHGDSGPVSGTAGEARFWMQRAAMQAETGRAEGGTAWRVLSFDAEDNEGTAGSDLAQLRSLPFALFHQPAGTAEGERLVFENKPFEDVFSGRGVPGTQGACARFQPARFFASDCFADDELAGEEGSETNPGRARSQNGTVSSDGAGGDGAPAGGTPTGGLPTFLDRARAEPLGTRTDGPEGEAAERFVYVFRCLSRADAEETGRPKVELISTWKATTAGTYQYAPVDAPVDAPEDPAAQPAPVGPEAEQVLLDATEPGAGQSALDVWSSPFALPQARLDQMAGKIRRAEGVCPFARQMAFSPWAMAWEGNVHAMASPVERAAAGAKVFLPAPMAMVEHQLEEAEKAMKCLNAWREKIAPAGPNAGLVAAPCYDEGQQRKYLRDALFEEERPPVRPRPRPRGAEAGRAVARQYAEERDTLFDMTREWGPDFPEAATGQTDAGPKGRELLGQFAYGRRCQELYLRLRVGRALDFARWSRGALLGVLTRDCYAADEVAGGQRGGPPTYHSDAGRRRGERLAAARLRLTQLGQDGHALAREEQEVGLLEHADALGPEDYDRLLEPLEGTSPEGGAQEGGASEEASPPLPWYEALKDSDFKLAWKLSLKSTQTAHQFAQGVAPIIAGFDFERREAAAALVAALTWKGTHRNRTFRTERANRRISYGDGDVFIAEAELSGRRRTGAKATPWRIHAQGQVKIDLEAATERLAGEQALGHSTAGLGAINAAIAAHAFVSEVRTGTADWGTLLAAGEALTGAAEVYDYVGDAARVARVLRVAGPLMEVAGAAWEVHQALTHEQQRGQQTVADPDGWGAVGAVVAGVGGLTMAAGTAPALVVGLLLVGVGAGLQWAETLVNRRERRAADPLSGWLPSSSVWGARYGGGVDRAALFRLLQKDGAAGASPLAPDVLEEETRGFVEHAYTFPTDARAEGPRNLLGRPTGEDVLTRRRRQVIAAPGTDVPASYDLRGEAGGVALRIAPEYVPARGTLMVDAEVQAVNAQGRAVLIPAPAFIRCAVHYVNVGGGRFRYCVRPEGAPPLALPEGEPPLPDWAEAQGWPVSQTATMRLPAAAGEEAEEATEEEMQVAVVPVVPLGQGSEAPASEAPTPGAFGKVESAELIEPAPAMTTGVDDSAWERMKARARVRRRRWDQRVEAEGLEAVLSAEVEHVFDYGSARYYYRGPRFVVSGSVFFDPAMPLNPDPDVPRTNESGEVITEEGAEKRLLSRGLVLEHAFPQTAFRVAP